MNIQRSHEPLMLRAGPLALLYEEGGLRYVRVGDHEVVRRVYCAVRDANWGTVANQISNLSTEMGDGSFRVEFDVLNQQDEIDFSWHGTVIGKAHGRVVFEMDGVARSAFRKNRIGFCVLHPMQLAGTAVIIRHANGTIEQAEFPRFIAAKNPFLDVVGLRHVIQQRVDLDLTFEGDIFETEDQRNWIDASFKTFCTPLARPFPAEVRAGERIFQRITIEVVGQSEKRIAARSEERIVRLEVAAQPRGALPHIGFSLAADAEPLTPAEVQRLKPLKPAHLRLELRLSGNFAPALRRAAATARDLNCGLDAILYFGSSTEAELTRLIELVAQLEPPIVRWTIFPATGWTTTRQQAEIARRILSRHSTSIPIGGGTPANFRELNGQRPPNDLIDFVTWSMNPQVHAFDNASLVETLAAHAAAVESARQFCGNLALVVGPVTLKMQVNPYATDAWPPPTPTGKLPQQVDRRQMSLFGAGWTLGSIKYLAESGVHAATFYELIGWKGLVEREDGSLLPDLFPSTAGAVFPLYHVFADVAGFSGSPIMPVRSSDPLRVEALALTSENQRRILFANLTPGPQNVVANVAADSAVLHIWDEANTSTVVQQPEAQRSKQPVGLNLSDGRLILELPSYALARVDLA